MPQWLVDLAQILEGIGVFVALVALAIAWRQLRQSTEQLHRSTQQVHEELRHSTALAKAANAQQLTAHAAAFNATIYQDATLTDLWYSFGQGLELRDPAQATAARRYREMLVQWLIFHENIHYQHAQQLLDRDLYETWVDDLRFTVRHHNLALVPTETGDIRDVFPGRFGDQLVRLQREPTAPGERHTAPERRA
jgi:hypothetical protein